MRLLEVRRHSLRDPYSGHLSAAGLELARSTATGVARPDRVVTSEKVRAIETAEALGLPVDRTLPELGQVPDEVQALVDAARPSSFAEYVALVERNRAVRDFAAFQVGIWRSEVDGLTEGGRLLIVSHGGIIELGAASAAPDAARGWGPPLSVLEGVRFSWEDGRCRRAEVLRLAK